MRPRHFAVGPSVSDAAVELGITGIVTDGTYFLHRLKSALIEVDCYLPDEIYERTGELRQRISGAYRELHNLSCNDIPGLIYAYSYLDGMRDGCDRMEARRKSGEYSDSHSLQHAYHEYEKHLDTALDRERFFDAAYIEGYLNVLTLLIVSERQTWRPTLWFGFTAREIRDLTALQSSARNLKRRNLPAWREATELVERLGPGIVPMHSPFLYGVIDPE